MKRVKKFGLLFGAFLIVFSVAISFFDAFSSQQASAAPTDANTQVSEEDVRNGTFTWVNRATIRGEIGDYTFIFYDGNVTDDYEYGVRNYGCHGTINPADNGSNDILETNVPAALDLDIRPAGSTGTSCQNIGGGGDTISITIGSASNADIWYQDNGDGTITRVDGQTGGERYIFQQNDADPNLYIRREDSDECDDRLYVNRSNNTYQMYVLDGGDLQDEFPPFPGFLQIGGANCRMRGISDDSWILGPRATWDYSDPNNTDSARVWVPTGIRGSSWPRLMVATTITDEDGNEIPLPGDADEQGGEAAVDESCEGNSGVLGWIMCPVAGLLDNILGFLDEQIQGLLVIGEGNNNYFTGDTGEDLFSIWQVIRNVAYIILIPIMLIMVIGTALGFEVFSAYTVKKALPRMVIAVIFITLSWYICIFLINFFNVVGSGIRGLVTNPFDAEPGIKGALRAAGIITGGDQGVWGTLQDGAGAGLGLAAATGAYVVGAISIGILLSTLGTVALILGIAFLILVARQMFILAAIFLAPLAILAWIFPGNDKLWKLWWNMFSKLLMMFPLIMLLIGLGEVFGNIIGTARSGSVAIITIIMVLAAVVLPYVALPFTFKWAGGVFGNLAGMVNDRNKGMLDRLKKGRADSREKHMGNAKNFSRFKGGNAFTRGLNKVGGMGTNNPSRYMSWGAAKRGRLVDTDRLSNAAAAGQAAKAAEDLKNDQVFQTNQNDDKFLLALGDKDAATAMRDAAETPAEQAAWNSALGNAALVRTKNSQATKLAALQAHAATGYNFEAGQAGYNQLANGMIKALNIGEKDVDRDASGNIRGVVGSQAGNFASAMNQAQYNLKGAGRFDLGGINNGDGYDASAGIKKASLYQLANGKKESITSMVQELPAGPLVGDVGERAAITYQELEAMKPNATGAVAGEIEKQMEALRNRGVETYMKQGVLDSSGSPEMIQTAERFDRDRGDPTHARYDAAYVASWSATDLAQGSRKVSRQKTLKDVASEKARTYQREDPNNIT